jgi:hypothetical protein
MVLVATLSEKTRLPHIRENIAARKQPLSTRQINKDRNC